MNGKHDFEGRKQKLLSILIRDNSGTKKETLYVHICPKVAVERKILSQIISKNKKGI